MRMVSRVVLSLAAGAGLVVLNANGVQGEEYQTRVVASGLTRPVGIALNGSGTIYFTLVPTPGVPGSRGGRNQVSAYNLASGERSVVEFGDPEPTDVAVARNGKLYWTCTSAGVIVEASPVRGR